MSRLPRFFIAPDQVIGRTITVREEDVRHIGSVLRMQPGDRLVLADGQGREYIVAITSLTRTEVLTEVLDERSRSQQLPRITLGQGLPKSDKMDLIVQKATELGVSAIVPLVTERTIVKVRDEEKRVGRWQKICREAAMQSDRPDIPTVAPIRTFRDFVASPVPGPRPPDPGLSAPRPGTLLLLPWEEGTKPLKTVLREHENLQDIVMLIGPEGGFSHKEAELAAAQGFQAVSLGPTILRTETAAIAALSMVGYEYF